MSTVFFKHISPFIRYAQIFHPMSGDAFSSGEYMSYDRRLYFCLEGRFAVYISGKKYNMSGNTLLTWQAGVPYRYETYEGVPTKILSINYDLTYKGERFCMPLPPVQRRRFESGAISDDTEIADAPWLCKTVCLDSMDGIKGELLEIVSEYRAQVHFFRERCSGILKSVLFEAARRRETGCDSFARGARINDILSYISENPAEDLSNETLGARFGYHPVHLNRIMLTYTGNTLHSYVLNSRINAAVQMLENTDMSISQISGAVGFDDASYFSKCFKNKTGKTPSSYITR